MIVRRLALTLLVLTVGVTALTFHPATVEARSKATYVYVHDASSPNRILAYAWAKDGTLTELPGSPFVTGLGPSGCGGLCQTLGYSKKRKALIASGDDGLCVFLIQKDGSLVMGAGSPYTPAGVSTSFNGVEAVDRGRNTFVYANEYGANAVHGYSLA